jgi:hypothetical protein
VILRTCKPRDLMPFGICVEHASLLEIFLPQACESKGKQCPLPFFLLFHDNVYNALGEFLRHFGDVYLLAARKFCFQVIDYEFVDAKAKRFAHRDTQLARPRLSHRIPRSLRAAG